MDDDPGLNPNVAIQLRWLIPTSRIQSIVQAARFACNARFADRFPVDLFSVVLTWPTTDPNLAHLRLLVPTEANRPIADRLL